MIKSLLITAYRSKCPLETIESSLIDHPTREMVNVLVPPDIDLSRADECDLMHDIRAYLQQRDEECSSIAWRSKFIYFATSMCHVFGRGEFYPDPTVPLVAYVKTGAPMPYVWLDLDESAEMRLVSMYGIEEPGFKVVIHTITGVNNLKSRDYTVGQTRSSEAIQLSLRLDLYGKTDDYLIARLAKPHPSLECVVMLTFRKKFSGVYYQSKHPLITNTIQYPANKS